MWRLLMIMGLVSLTGAAHAGVVMVSEQTMANGTASTSTLYLQGNRMRMEASNGMGVALFDGPSQRFVVLDAQHKTYTELTPAQIQAAQAQLQQAMQQMQQQMQQAQQQLANLPPEQRKMVEAMMSGQAKGMPGMPQSPTSTPSAAPQTVKPTFTKSGSEKVGEWPCDHYVGTVNGQKRVEIWAASEQTVGVPATDLAVMKTFRERFYGSMAQMPGVNAAALPPSTDDVPGIPVKTVRYDANGKSEGTMLLKKIEQRALDAALFAVPTGFTPQAMPTLPQQ